jgi:transcriptional regulator with XRE-family HTH domain
MPAVEPDVVPFGSTLRKLRRQRGWTQKRLAQEAQISISIIFHAEQATRLDPRLSTLRRLARALNCSIDTLAGVRAIDGEG